MNIINIKLPWGVKYIKPQRKSNEPPFIILKINPFWLFLKKLQFFMTIRIYVKWKKGLKIIIKNPKNFKLMEE